MTRVLWLSDSPAPKLDDAAAVTVVTPKEAGEHETLADLVVASTLVADELEAAQAQSRTGAVVFLGERDSFEQCLQAMRAGYADYLPTTDDVVSELASAVERQRARWRSPDAHLVVDPLSGLASHAQLQATMTRRLAESARHSRPVSLLLVDVDGFDALNEAGGYNVGDRVLREIGGILSGDAPGFRIRESDVPGRLRGDVFGVLLPETDRRGAAVHANKLRIFVERHRFEAIPDSKVSVSVGVASREDGRVTRSELLKQAEDALSAAKRRGKNRVVSFTSHLEEGGPDLGKAFQVEVELLQALEESLEKGLFKAVFQPLVDAKTLKARAYEALSRPQHDAFPGPYQMFMTAERAGRVAELGRATRKIAMESIGDLPDGCSLFLNLHPLELNSQLEEEAARDLAPFAERIVLEITETAQLPESEYHTNLIKDLRAAGFRVALDDLGSGYAGLNSLSALQPDIVKLDMKLIRALKTEPATSRLVRHIIEFAVEENMEVVAEGVETPEEAHAAIDLGCHLLQGYYFAKPGPPFPEVVGKLDR